MAYEYPLPPGPVPRDIANLYLQASWRRYEAEQNRLNQEAAYRAKQPNFADQFVTYGLKAFDDWIQEDRKNRLADRESERQRANKAYGTEIDDAFKRSYTGWAADQEYDQAQRGHQDRGRAIQSYMQGRSDDFQSPVAEPLSGMDPREVGILYKEGMPGTTQAQLYDPTMIGQRQANTQYTQARTGLTGLQADLASQRLQLAPERHAQEMEVLAQRIQLMREQAQKTGNQALLIEAQTLEQRAENEIVDYLRMNGEQLIATPHILSMYQSIAKRRDSRLRPQEIETNAYAARYGQNQADRDMPVPQRGRGPSGLDQRIESYKQMYRIGVQLGKFPPMTEQEIEFKARHDAGFGMDSMIRLMRELGIDISGMINKPPVEKTGPTIPGLGSPGRP